MQQAAPKIKPGAVFRSVEENIHSVAANHDREL
jgi:hypothetical protein